MTKRLNRLIFIFSLFGLAVSAFLAYEYSLGGPISCPIGGGCELVRKSTYSSLLGIQLPYFGLVFYFGLAFVSVWLVQSYNRLVNLLRFLISFFGFISGLYLTFLEAFVIKAYCFWCVVSFIVSIIIFILCIIHLKKYAK